MKMSRMIKAAIEHAMTSQSEVSRQLGYTNRQNFLAKISRESVSLEEMEQIGELVGAKFVCHYEFPDGSIIG